MATDASRLAGRSPIGLADEAIGARRVLVVEDDDAKWELLADLVSDAGYTVTVLNSALGMHEAVQRLRPVAVLLDLGLPYRSGIALLEELRGDPATATLPVIVISALTDFLPPDRAALATAVMSKSFDTDMLLELLETVA